MIVLDTNVVSEPLRKEPDKHVLAWLAQPRELVITSVTVGELLSGVRMLPFGRRRTGLLAAVESALRARSGRVLPYDDGSARSYAELREHARSIGLALTVEDGMIAAICRYRNLPLATRNTKDFERLEIDLINPWEPDPE